MDWFLFWTGIQGEKNEWCKKKARLGAGKLVGKRGGEGTGKEVGKGGGEVVGVGVRRSSRNVSRRTSRKGRR